MTTVEKIRELMGLPKTTLYAESRLDDGRVIVTEAEAFAPGVEVRILDDSGEAAMLDAGEYTLEDGTKYAVTEDSRLASLGEDEEIEVEVEMAEEEVEEEEVKVEEEEMDSEKARAILKERFPDLDDALIDAIAEVAAEIYNAPSVEVEVEASAEEVKEEVKEDLGAIIEEAFASISDRLKALEDAPASKGVSHSPNKLSAQHKSADTKNLSSVERALHVINSHK